MRRLVALFIDARQWLEVVGEQPVERRGRRAAGQDTYAIGTRLFPRATLNLPAGRDFTIVATGGGPGRPYVQTATLDGRALTRCALTHGQVTAGGTLRFTMGTAPETAWVSAPGVAPVASDSGRSVELDRTAALRVRAVSPGAGNPSPPPQLRTASSPSSRRPRGTSR